MAYGAKNYRKTKARKAPTKRATVKRATASRGGGTQTVRIVLETAPAGPARAETGGYPFMQPAPRNTGKAKR